MGMWWPRHEADHSPQIVVRLGMSTAVPPFLLYASMVHTGINLPYLTSFLLNTLKHVRRQA